MGQVRPNPGWLGQIRPSFFILFFLLKEKFKKYLFVILQVSRVFFYVILINIKQYFLCC